ncbi:MAG: YezD family protein [Acutalibacteraceae bacterium]
MQKLKDKEDVVEKCLNEVKNALDGLKYGTVTIIVQDGIPIQIDTTEKTRLK